jgi:hypothetical protein
VNSTYFVDGEIEGTLLMGTSDKTVMGLPEGFPDLSVIPSEAMRTVRFDLSGFSCRLGLRIRLWGTWPALPRSIHLLWQDFGNLTRTPREPVCLAKDRIFPGGLSRGDSPMGRTG